MAHETEWRWTQWGHERQQNRNIGYLNEELAFQRRANRRTQDAMRAQLTRLSGDLSGRIDTIGRALDSFVELSDLRFELAVHQPAAAVRAAVRAYLVAAADSSAVAAAELPEATGYWLRPAALALSARLTGDGSTAHLAAAHALDHRRTELFLATALAATGHPDAAAEHLPQAVGDFHGELTRAQLSLWLGSVHGHFGRTGDDFLDTWMRERLAGDEDPAAKAAWDEFGAKRLHVTPVTGAPRAAHFAARLDRLRAFCVESMAAAPPKGREELFSLIEDLVDEGTPLEAPLLRRSLELRRQIEERTTQPMPVEHFDDPAGTVDAVLAGVAAGDDPAARARAITVGAPRLLAMSERLRAEATLPFGENTRQVRRAGVTLTVSAMDTHTDVSALRPEVERRHPRPDPVRWALAALGMAVLALALTYPVPGLAILLAAAAIGLGVKWFAVRKAATETDGTVAYVMKALEKDVAAAHKALIDRREQAALAATEAERAHRELAELLGGKQ
ncbi:hypothetical protein AB0I28_34540 [Phytomonospora sp. NPDC050363]|uniref:hypothetical protein n=1 Tax=Phytomonospora sp. NPDC050363 TaxID=3155642 RepID=UPI0033CB2396